MRLIDADSFYKYNDFYKYKDSYKYTDTDDINSRLNILENYFNEMGKWSITHGTDYSKPWYEQWYDEQEAKKKVDHKQWKQRDFSIFEE